MISLTINNRFFIKITSTSLMIVILFVGEKVKSMSIYEEAGMIPLIGVIVISWESFKKVNSNSKLIGILFFIWCLYKINILILRLS